jgi:hypothetical protein
MKRRPLRARRFVHAATLTCTMAVLTLGLTPGASQSSTQNRLFAYVVATNGGPLSACSPDSCSPANSVAHFLYVVNANRFEPAQIGGPSRPEVTNAFVVSSVDERIFVDDVDTFDSTMIPPPEAVGSSFAAGRWPSTVTCGPAPPCNLVGSPAVIPGENTSIVYTRWAHADFEPNGTYVFRFTVHGTLNGTPVDLTASSKPILMTD